MQDVEGFITANLELAGAPGVPDLRLYTARPSSGLGRFLGDDAPAPYWAYPWAGGLALARYLAERPCAVAGLRVLDYGAGSGLVGIAAAKAGAAKVLALEIDPFGRIAVALNSAANDAAVEVVPTEAEAPADVDLVLAGDVFYAPDVARRTLAALDGYLSRGVQVLVGDPGRADLPLNKLLPLAEYEIPDFGRTAGRGYVYAYRPG